MNFQEIIMPRDNVYCKLIFGIKIVILEQSVNLLG